VNLVTLTLLFATLTVCGAGCMQRMREFCESVAFYGGNAKEREQSDAQFQDAYDVMRELLRVNFPLRTWLLLANNMAILFAYGFVGIQSLRNGARARLRSHPRGGVGVIDASGAYRW
jgi:hypothetical protein